MNGPLSGLFYRTEKYRSEEIRGGASRIRPWMVVKKDALLNRAKIKINRIKKNYNTEFQCYCNFSF